MNIDAKNQVIGRIASIAAKKALLGEHVNIVNCEQAVISGTKTVTLQRMLHMHERGTWAKGPFIHRMPDRLMKRMIRGMVPWDRGRGKMAMRKIKCYIGVPDELQKESFIAVPGADSKRLTNTKTVTLKEICRHMGGRL